MQDKNDDVALLQIPRRWFLFFSKVFIWTMCAFTVLAIIDQFIFQIKIVQNFFDNKWLHRGSVLMTLIVGYIFIVARWGHRITLKDSNKRYEEGQEEGRKAEREKIIDLVKKDGRINLPKSDLLKILESGDYDP